MALTEGAPVVIVDGSLVLHVASHHRLGRGGHRTPLSAYLAQGWCPVRWTSVCGRVGVVVMNRGFLLDVPVCDLCLHPTIVMTNRYTDSQTV